MGAPAGNGGLARAHEEIARLLEELDTTVETIEVLTRAGEDDEALRIIEAQRASLIRFVDDVSGDLAAPRRWWNAARRHMIPVAAAAALLVSSLAVSAGLSRDDPNDRLFDAATAQLQHAHQVRDPAVRVEILTKVVQKTRLLPGHLVDGSELDADLGALIRRTRNEIEDDVDPDPVLVRKVRELSDPTPPSTGQSPIDTLRSIVDG